MATRTDALRIGEVAERAGTTARTVRYYEEIGLLPGSGSRAHGQHRLYGEADVERLVQILRLKDLLGLSLDELRELVEAEDARASLRARWSEAEGEDAATRRDILTEALLHIERQLALVRGRLEDLAGLERQLAERKAVVRTRLRELERESG